MGIYTSVKSTFFYFTLLLSCFSVHCSDEAPTWMENVGISSAVTLNTGTERNVLLASRQGSALVDRAALAVGTQGSMLVDRAAIATLEQGSRLVDQASHEAGEQGNKLIDKAAQETQKTAESLLTTATDKAYKVGYDTGYGTVTGVFTALKDGALKAAPYLALLGGGYLLYRYCCPHTPTLQEQVSDATASNRIAQLEKNTNTIYSELSLIECFNNCVFGKRSQTGIPTACETQFHTYASLAGNAQAAQKAAIFRESCPTNLE